ncbi:SGNH/GDSL hydrolase family protein [Nocardia sp. XZ_19_385]|uniref:SGNH/GDSL hydrolase family protein n=1 Tax=Nocardia sp. XZ_19_385 TaxID=2769488 RepID=UPI00188F3D4C|nr:SGNH/GDSL hydrolase family protein [Nocardia sp. XZ_19_385]
MRKISAVAAALAGLLATSVPASANPAPQIGQYVALGDSYAAIADATATSGVPGCFRSTSNYANVVAASLRPIQFVDNSCSEARTQHMTESQFVVGAFNPPQFDGLNADTDLVTITIGANDLDPVTALGTCGALAATDPHGNPCERFQTASGTDQLAELVRNRIRPRVLQVFHDIRARAPHATIVAVGYLPQFPESGGCWPAVPVANGDVPYLRRIFRSLSQVLLDAAREVDGIGVDPSGITGHDMCQAPGVRWVEPLVPAAPTTPLHPNARGDRALGELILAALD